MDLVQLPQFNSHLSFEISKWSAWAPGCQTRQDWVEWSREENNNKPLMGSAVPGIKFLPIGMRKGLSDVCKVMLYLAEEILDEQQKGKARVVYASRHGEAQTTVELLNSIKVGELTSPMAFARSVLNTPVGLFSIHNKNKSPNTAVSAMADTFRAGLLESVLQLYGQEPEADNEEPILYVYGDEAVPECFTPYITEPSVPYGVAFLIKKGKGRTAEFPTQVQPYESLEFLRSVISIDG